MQVGDDHPGDRLALQPFLEGRAPGLGRLAGLQAGVDHGPPLAVGDGPDVDELQRPAERHPHPFHARRNLAHISGSDLGTGFKRVIQFRTPNLGRRVFHAIPQRAALPVNDSIIGRSAPGRN
jgi:hypothetical protein